MGISLVKSEVIPTLRIIAFQDERTLAAGGGATEILVFLTPLRPLSSITPVELDISYGLADDPTDEKPEWYLAAVDRDNVPDQNAMRRIAAWQTVQVWRSLGTPGQVVQTITRENADFFRPKTWLNELVGDRQRRVFICIVSSSDTTSALRAQGVITFVENIIQRTFGSDNAYSDMLLEEISEDEED